MQIYWNKRKRLHKKRVQFPEDWFGTPTWPPFHCFGTPIWPTWRHVKTLYWTLCTVTFAKHEPNKRLQTSKGVFERRTSTGITCDQASLLSFLYGWRKGKFSSPFPSADLSPFCEKRTTHRRLQPEVSPFPFKYAVTISVYSLTNIKAICLKTWQNHCPKNKTSSSRWLASLKIASVG